MKVLAGDIGGTNARLTILERSDHGFRLVREQRYPSGQYSGLVPIVEAFLRGHDDGLAGACLAVAGPVVDGHSKTPNLPWHIAVDALAAPLGDVPCLLINDFEAVGYGLGLLGEDDLATLQAGEVIARKPIGLLGAGTGLGQAMLVWDGDDYRVCPTEGGHADFAPRSEVEWGLRQYLSSQLNGRVSVERVLSGSGLAHIYDYLVHSGRFPRDPSVVEAMAQEDRAAVVTRFGLAELDRACTQALDLFIGVYGAEAGNMALRCLAEGGVYLAGGIAPRLLERLSRGGFLAAFSDKGRMRGLVSGIPVHVITNTQVGVLGAGVLAARAAQRHTQ